MIEQILTTVESQFLANYGFIFAGLLGAIAYRAANWSSVKQFLLNCINSAFFALVAGISAKQFFVTWSDEFVFAVCAIVSYFTKDIVTETRQIIDMTSELIREKVKGKSDDDMPAEN
jgi:hypothetical protein